MAFFRIVFGLMMLVEATTYLEHDWIHQHWLEPVIHFTYYGFGWVKPWPGDWLYVHFVALAVLAVLITLGLFYRLAAALFFLGFTYTFLLEQATYLNHFYLVCLVAFLMPFLPAHRAWSLDAWRKPALRSDVAPVWALWMLQGQVGIAYFFGGVAKLNSDWLIAGEPMRMWLADTTDFPVIGQWFTHGWVPYLFSWGGMLLDLLILPALLWRRTRRWAVIPVVAFHLMNSRLFVIGIFPWLMLAATGLYFAPDWPRKLLAWLGRWRRGGSTADSAAGASVAQKADGSAGRFPGGDALSATAVAAEDVAHSTSVTSRRPRLVVSLVLLYAAIQVLVPLRHWLYPGNVSWTEEGHRFAWHMKLRTKTAEGRFEIVSKETGEAIDIDVSGGLMPWQTGIMLNTPDMLLQFCHAVAARMKDQGFGEVAIYAHIESSLNGRPSQRFIDPTVDLASQPRSLAPADWIVPLTTPLN